VDYGQTTSLTNWKRKTLSYAPSPYRMTMFFFEHSQLTSIEPGAILVDALDFSSTLSPTAIVMRA
jgi:hypothetical protein